MSSPPLRVFLTLHQEDTLFELSRASQVNQRTKDRASAIRLSSRGWKVDKIAVYLKWSKKRVRETIHKWQEKGLVGLWDAPKTGRKKKWTTEDIAEIEKKLETESRSYNSRLYTWGKRGEQKRIEQTKKKGKRLNICGLLEVGKSFEYGLALKSFKSESYIKLMDWQATQAKERWEKTGQLTVVVQDQGSIQISKLTKSHYEKWAELGLLIFLLPSYSPELNLIEPEWQRVKEDELAASMFEDEYDLIQAVIGASDQEGRITPDSTRSLFVWVRSLVSFLESSHVSHSPFLQIAFLHNRCPTRGLNHPLDCSDRSSCGLFISSNVTN